MNIHTAARRGNVARVSELLHAGVPVNTRDANGYTPLMWAANKGNVRMIRFLLKKGANARLKNQHNVTPLILATQVNSLPAMRELLRHSNINAKNLNGQSALAFAAAHTRDPAGARMLLRAGAKLDSNTREYLYPGHGSSNTRWRNLVTEMLVRRGGLKSALPRMYTAMRMRKAKARTGGNNTLARTVFHPERVQRMQKRYGNNWLNKV